MSIRNTVSTVKNVVVSTPGKVKDGAIVIKESYNVKDSVITGAATGTAVLIAAPSVVNVAAGVLAGAFFGGLVRAAVKGYRQGKADVKAQQAAAPTLNEVGVSLGATPKA